MKDHTEWFPNTSFGERGPTMEWLAEAGYYFVSGWKPYDSNTEKLITVPPYLYDGMCCIVDVIPLTEADLAARKADQWNAIRSQRNQMLKDSDWTQIADVPVDKTAWATYRQELRDVTKQTDPFNIVWPSVAVSVPCVVEVSGVSADLFTLG